jgi:hypothetical protein
VELELVILPRAQKDLARLPHSDRERIKTRIEAYAAATSGMMLSHWSGRDPGIDCGLGTGG